MKTVSGRTKSIAGVLAFCVGMNSAFSQSQAVIQVDPGKEGARISPTLHGIFFEEISHAGEGGLYAELIQNRGFEDSRLPRGTTLQDGNIVPERTPHFMLMPEQASDWKMPWMVKSPWPAWTSRVTGNSTLLLSLTADHPLNKATPRSLEVKVTAKDTGKSDLLNEGFWGINTVAGEAYKLSFYVRNPDAYKGALTASLQSKDGTVLASHTFTTLRKGEWTKYTCSLRADRSDPAAQFVLSFGSTGTLWFDMVSLFPEKTFKGRPNGLRADLAQYIADLKPSFIRWPGGCYVEGINIQSAPDWKSTLGPVEKRPGTFSPWGYWSSDGFGYQEYLQYCEDIGAAALYVFNVGVSCEFRSGTFIPDDSLAPVIQNALDAIEYAIGPVSSKWGKLRAANGHAAPFPLKYVEVGNEQHGPRYAQRYNRFYEAIRKKYPAIRIIASMGIADVNRNTLDSMHQVDIADEHAYKGVDWSFTHNDHFDNYKRGKWELYVGEYATNGGVGRGNMAATLSDAVYMMAMERNSDLVKMSSYAPLLVNVNDESWPVNLINFDAGHSFARISYYAIKMFNENRPDVNLATTVQVLPPAEKIDQFSGGIGLGTWDTQSEYKDIQVEKNGKILYKADFGNRAADWQPIRGDWKKSDSSIRQMAAGAQLLALLKDSVFDTYTLTLKARKTDGYNAFIIPFAVKDSNDYLRAHIGSYVNSHCVFEKVSGGYEVSDLTDQQRMKTPIEKGRWYSIRLAVQTDKVACYLDGKLLMEYKTPDKVFAISGREEKTGDLLIKMVNATGADCTTTLQIAGSPLIDKEALLTTLAAEGEKSENSFEHPTATVPVNSLLQHASDKFLLNLPPYSVNVLRLKETKKGVDRSIIHTNFSIDENAAIIRGASPFCYLLPGATPGCCTAAGGEVLHGR